MKIAQIAPLMESVPPRLYGGTERVVSHLCEALVRKGHEVTLFATGDSITSADLVPCTTEAIRLNPAVKDHIPHYMIMLDKVRRIARRFDVLHFHIDAFHMPLFRDVDCGNQRHLFRAERESLGRNDAIAALPGSRLERILEISHRTPTAQLRE